MYVFFSTSVVVICFLLLSVSIVPEVLVQQNTRKDSEKAKFFDSGNGIVGKEFLNCKIIKPNKTSIFFHSLLEAIKIYWTWKRKHQVAWNSIICVWSNPRSIGVLEISEKGNIYPHKRLQTIMLLVVIWYLDDPFRLFLLRAIKYSIYSINEPREILNCVINHFLPFHFWQKWYFLRQLNSDSLFLTLI